MHISVAQGPAKVYHQNWRSKKMFEWPGFDDSLQFCNTMSFWNETNWVIAHYDRPELQFSLVLNTKDYLISPRVPMGMLGSERKLRTDIYGFDARQSSFKRTRTRPNQNPKASQKEPNLIKTSHFLVFFSSSSFTTWFWCTLPTLWEVDFLVRTLKI